MNYVISAVHKTKQFRPALGYIVCEFTRESSSLSIAHMLLVYYYVDIGR